MIKKITVILGFMTFVSNAQQPNKSPPNKNFTPTATIDILYAKPFQLNQGYRYDWSKERPFVTEGVLVVLEVDPKFVKPTNALQPVLFAGNQTVQRLNHGYESGIVIGIIPGRVDLPQTPIWFGHPALPEQVSTDTITSESNLASNSNIKAFSKKKIDNIMQSNMTAENLAELLFKDAAELILEYSPTEKYLAENWRMADAK